MEGVPDVGMFTSSVGKKRKSSLSKNMKSLYETTMNFSSSNGPAHKSSQREWPVQESQNINKKSSKDFYEQGLKILGLYGGKEHSSKNLNRSSKYIKETHLRSQLPSNDQRNSRSSISYNMDRANKISQSKHQTINKSNFYKVKYEQEDYSSDNEKQNMNGRGIHQHERNQHQNIMYTQGPAYVNQQQRYQQNYAQTIVSPQYITQNAQYEHATVYKPMQVVYQNAPQQIQTIKTRENVILNQNNQYIVPSSDNVRPHSQNSHNSMNKVSINYKDPIILQKDPRQLFQATSNTKHMIHNTNNQWVSTNHNQNNLSSNQSSNQSRIIYQGYNQNQNHNSNFSHNNLNNNYLEMPTNHVNSQIKVHSQSNYEQNNQNSQNQHEMLVTSQESGYFNHNGGQMQQRNVNFFQNDNTFNQYEVNRQIQKDKGINNQGVLKKTTKLKYGLDKPLVSSSSQLILKDQNGAQIFSFSNISLEKDIIQESKEDTEANMNINVRRSNSKSNNKITNQIENEQQNLTSTKSKIIFDKTYRLDIQSIQLNLPEFNMIYNHKELNLQALKENQLLEELIQIKENNMREGQVYLRELESIITTFEGKKTKEGYFMETFGQNSSGSFMKKSRKSMFQTIK